MESHHTKCIHNDSVSEISETESELLGLPPGSTTPLSPSHFSSFDAMVSEKKKEFDQTLLDRLEEEHTRMAINQVGTHLVEKVNRLKRKRNDLLENVDKVLQEQNRLRQQRSNLLQVIEERDFTLKTLQKEIDQSRETSLAEREEERAKKRQRYKLMNERRKVVEIRFENRISTLNKLLLAHYKGEKDGDARCPCCLEIFNNLSNIPCVSECGHTICVGCVPKLEAQQECIICRTPISKEHLMTCFEGLK